MKTLRKWSILEIWENKFWMKLFTHIIAPHSATGSQTMINDATPDIARTLHTFIKRIGCPGQRVGCAIYAEETVANAMMERLSNALHLKTGTVAMSLSQTILNNRCINQLFYNQEKVDTSTKLFSECTFQHIQNGINERLFDKMLFKVMKKWEKIVFYEFNISFTFIFRNRIMVLNNLILGISN